MQKKCYLHWSEPRDDARETLCHQDAFTLYIWSCVCSSVQPSTCKPHPSCMQLYSTHSAYHACFVRFHCCALLRCLFTHFTAVSYQLDHVRSLPLSVNCCHNIVLIMAQQKVCYCLAKLLVIQDQTMLCWHTGSVQCPGSRSGRQRASIPCQCGL